MREAAEIMREFGLKHLSFSKDGFSLTASEKEVNQEQQKAVELATQALSKIRPVSDEELLFDPYAGIEDET